MATVNSTVVALHPVKAKTAAERAAAYRARKKSRVNVKAPPLFSDPKSDGNCAAPINVADKKGVAPINVAAVTPVTSVKGNCGDMRGITRDAVTPSRSVAQLLLVGTSFALAGVGITMNGWFAHTLGSSEIAGWLFSAIGVAADCVALAIPSCAALKWQASQRGAALAGWVVWFLTFVFAVTAGIGFASVNITDVTASRASRVTPAVTVAQTALDDAKAARDRECKNGAGKFCREREAQVVERQTVLSSAMYAVEQKADPQTETTRRMVAWVSFGTLKPSGEDFSMLRLVLLSLLPQLGGILLMVSRR